MFEVTEQDVNEARDNLNISSVRTIKENNDLSILDRLTHKNRARAFWRQFGFNELQQVNESLSEILKESEAVYLEIQEKNRSRESLISKIESLIEAEGFSLADVFQGHDIQAPFTRKTKRTGKRRKYGSTPIRYKVRIFDRSFYWTGVGATPTAFRCAYIERGTKKSDYRLPKDIERTKEKSKQ